MTLAVRRQASILKGSAKPRIAPPTPARSRVREFKAAATKIGIDLYPWQVRAGRYLTGLDSKDHWLYPEVAIIVGRQNGKTTLLLPLITSRLLAGQRIMHTAQNRELPREIHDAVATILAERFPDQLPAKRGIRYGAGQEEIRLRNGARYRIVAPTRGGARGPSNDLVLIDELREMETHDFIAAAEPTLSASVNPQIVYLSNAGTETSAVLNGIRARRNEDPALAYLEWSAEPGRAATDIAGWLEANPSIGHQPGKIEYLQRKFHSYRLAGQLAIFETEHLCRWVGSIREALVAPDAWARREAPDLGAPLRPSMGISMDPAGTRASAAIAWPRPGEGPALRMLYDVTGHPIDVDRLGRDLREASKQHGVIGTGYDPLTDALLAKYLSRAAPVVGQSWANASALFVSVVESGKLVWSDCSAVGADLTWTTRKPHDESGSFQAVRGNDDRPITAALAAIRAVWLASAPAKPAAPRIFGSF